MTDEATMRAAMTERLARLREAEVQAAYQLGRAAGAAAEVALLLSGFDEPYPPDGAGVGTGDGGGPVSGAAGSSPSSPDPTPGQ